MATEKLSAQATEGKYIPEWQKERLEVIRQVQEHILDPLVTFAELMRGYDADKQVNLTTEEFAGILRLVLLGCYTETKLYGTFGGSLTYFSGQTLEENMNDWRNMQGGAA